MVDLSGQLSNLSQLLAVLIEPTRAS